MEEFLQQVEMACDCCKHNHQDYELVGTTNIKDFVLVREIYTNKLIKVHIKTVYPLNKLVKELITLCSGWAYPCKNLDAITAIVCLEHFGSDEDPIIYKRRETTPRGLEYDRRFPSFSTSAKQIRIKFYGRTHRDPEHKFRSGSLYDMVVDRMNMIK